MKYTISAMVILFVLSSVIAHADCWKDVAKKEQAGFGSDEQIKSLQEILGTKNSCQVIGVSWRIKLDTGLVIDSALIFEKEPQRLWRIKIENMAGVYKDSVSWLGWSFVTEEKLKALRPETGFQLEGQHSGKGLPELNANTKSLLKIEAPKHINTVLGR